MTPDIPLVMALIAIMVAAMILGVVLFFLRRRSGGMQAGESQALLQLQQQVTDLARHVETAVREITSRTDSQLQFGTKALTDLVLSSQTTVAQQVADHTLSVGRAVGTLQERLAEVGGEIRHLSEMGQDLRRLQDILKAPKVRGGLGERLLESLLANLLPGSHFTLQHSFLSGEKVDAAIRLPGGLVPVDAKFPLENFQRILSAQGDEETRRARRAFLEDIRRHAQNIAAKYIRPAEGTLDLALMYVPAENVYYEAFVLGAEREEGADLWQVLLDRRVCAVSPNSFAFYLTTLSIGLRGMRVAEEAQRIVGALSALEGDLEAFREAFDLTGRHLTNAVRNFEDSRARLDRFSGRLHQVDAETVESPSASGEGENPNS